MSEETDEIHQSTSNTGIKKVIKWVILLTLLIISGVWFLSFYVSFPPLGHAVDAVGAEDFLPEKVVDFSRTPENPSD